MANASQVSLRTIQRIENGESSPRGDTLNRIFDALGISTDSADFKTLKDQKWVLHLLIVSSLPGIIIQPVFGILGPIILWLLKRNEVNLIDNFGKKNNSIPRNMDDNYLLCLFLSIIRETY